MARRAGPLPVSLRSDRHCWATCAGINVSGNFCRNKYPAFFCKGVSTNPSAPIPHFQQSQRAPDCSVWLVEPPPYGKKSGWWSPRSSEVCCRALSLSSQGVCHVGSTGRRRWQLQSERRMGKASAPVWRSSSSWGWKQPGKNVEKKTVSQSSSIPMDSWYVPSKHYLHIQK